MKRLNIEDSTIAEIKADVEWNKTGVELIKGNTYKLEVVGDAKWKDWFITSGPEGFTKWYLHLSSGKKRMKNENWFALIGTYNGENPFLIGSGLPEFKALMTGELICYANDVMGFYWNNSGAIELKITRVE